MELDDKIKREILEINLTSIENKEYEEGLIEIDEPTFNFFLKTLEEDELYEKCSLLLKNKYKMVKN